MRAAVYLRVSSESQAQPDRFSIPMQRRACYAIAAARGDGSPLEYADEGVSAYLEGVDHRPALRQLLHDAEAGLFCLLVVYSLDRLARDPATFYDCMRVLERCRVELVSASQFFDDSVDGHLIRDITVAVSRAESARLSKRVSDALLEKARAGRWTGKRPYGYSAGPDGIMVVDDAQAAGYALMVKLCLEGVETYREIARVLNGAGYRTSKGNPWSGVAVTLVLTSPAYLGQVVLRESDSPVSRVAIPGLHPALVDRETWERVQSRCREMSNGQAGTHKAMRPYPVSGIVLCARCGRRLVGMRSSRPVGDDRYYLCSARNSLGAEGCDLPMIRASALEEAIAALLDRVVLPDNWREEVLAGTTTPQPGPSEADIAAEEKRLTQLYQDGYVSYEEFKKRWGIVTARRERARPPAVSVVLGLGAILERGIGQLWRQSPDNVARRRLLRALFVSITVDAERATEPRVKGVEWKREAEPLTRWLRPD